MQIAYHPTGSSLTSTLLDAWIASTLSGWPAVGAGTLISVKGPSYPVHVEDSVNSEDKMSLGGRQFSKVRYTGRIARLEFRSVLEADAAKWRLFYSATQGFRLPFILEEPLTLTKTAYVGSGAFPFSHDSMLTYAGRVEWVEYL